GSARDRTVPVGGSLPAGYEGRAASAVLGPVRPAGRIAPRRSTEHRTMTLLPRSLCTIILVPVALIGAVLAQGERAAAKGARDPLPVREVTAFKDGHACVLREGSMQPDADGRVVLEGLPVPVLGTFWPYATGDARVVSATAGRDRVVRQHEAVELRDWIDANAGADVVLVDITNE